jgi:SSS family solute:Na+ symporter
MELLVTYGALAVFFAVVVAILQRSYVADRDFSDFTVAGRSFGGFYQAMAFLNTGLPGFMYLGAFGFIVRAGVLGIGISTLLATIVMYLMADRVWTWGATHELRTQPDLMALRYDSRAVRIVSALLGIFGLMPWMVLGMQALGAVFYALSLGHLSFATSVVLGVTVMALRQVWTIRMGMRGIIISDLFQGIVAYFLGSALIIGLIAWLYSTGATLDQLPAEKFMLPGPDSPRPLLFFSLTLLPLLAFLCWPDLFIRLYTGSGVESVKRSSAYCGPIALVFLMSLAYLALLASGRADVAANPDAGWFTLALAAGGPPLVALAGVTVFAASMGNIDATVQSIGAQVANDVIGPVRKNAPGRSRPDDHVATRDGHRHACCGGHCLPSSAGAVHHRALRHPDHGAARRSAVPRHLYQARKQAGRRNRDARRYGNGLRAADGVARRHPMGLGPDDGRCRAARQSLRLPAGGAASAAHPSRAGAARCAVRR